MRAKFFLILSFIFRLSIFCQDKNGGFEKIPYEMQETAPGMILVEGMINNQPEKYGLNADTLRPFYISAYEETNWQYVTYLNFIEKYYSESTYIKALPDTSLWLKENIGDSLKVFLARNYLRSYIYQNHPVVGLNPEQIKKYAEWKTDRLNEMILIREGVLNFFEAKDSSELFTTASYLSGNWSRPRQKLPTFDAVLPERDVRMEDGILFPPYRIATGDEWKLAALAMGDKAHSYLVTPKPYNHKKFDKKNYFGHLFFEAKAVAAFHYMHIAQAEAIGLYSVDRGPFGNYNNYLIYGMYNNVSEWALDSGGLYTAMGGSWKSPAQSYAAFYTTSTPGNKYEYVVKFPVPQKEQANVSAAIGFRLAMDYIGALDPRIKRKQVKTDQR